MTAKRLRANRPEHKKVPMPKPPRPVQQLATGHYDGDGCTFPDPRHFAPAP